jgi:hypothetical protein
MYLHTLNYASYRFAIDPSSANGKEEEECTDDGSQLAMTAQSCANVGKWPIYWLNKNYHLRKKFVDRTTRFRERSKTQVVCVFLFTARFDKVFVFGQRENIKHSCHVFASSHGVHLHHQVNFTVKSSHLIPLEQK